MLDYQNTLKELKTEGNIRMKERYDKTNKVEHPKYKLGDKVLVKVMDIHKKRHPKFQPKYRGPYTIIKQHPLATYQIDTGEDKGLVDHVHADRLKLWTERTTDPEDPDLQISQPKSPENEWEIIRHMRTRRSLKFLVTEKNAPPCNSQMD